MDSKIVISLKDVSVRYNHHVVLEEINLNIRKKEIAAIVGPNGSGKTTLLHTVLGFKLPFKGEISVLDQKPRDIQNSGKIGYLPQNDIHEAGFPIKAVDVVAMSRYSKKNILEILNASDHEHIESALAKVEMLEHQHHHFGSLSGGQKQRILIARALALKPEILILDEPSTGLDAVAQDSFYHLLQNLRDKEDLSILLVSHDIGTVSSIVDTIAFLNKRIHFHGDPKHCIPPEALENVFGKNVQFLLHDFKCATCGKKHE
jgi:zinc transport system ATP-binding protein